MTSKLHIVCVCNDKLKIKVYASDLYFKSNKKMLLVALWEM